MRILLYGPDAFRSSAKLKEIISRYKGSGKKGLNILEAGNISVEDVEAELVSSSMFKERKLLVFKHVFQEKPIKDFFLSHTELLEKAEHTLVFFEEKDIPSKDGLFQFLEKNGKVQKFEILSGPPLLSWIAKEGGKYGVSISKEAGKELAALFESDLWALAQEIQKIALFKLSAKDQAALKEGEPRPEGSGREISVSRACPIRVEDVRALSPQVSFETDIFATIDAIGRKKKELALELLHEHLVKGDSPIYLLSMIHFQFRNILQVKDSSRENIHMHPFVAKKSHELASLFSMDELKAVYEKIWKTDCAVKTGAMDGETALDLLLLR